MDLLIASGESKRSELWASNVVDELAPFYDNIEVLQYAHWASPDGGTTDIDHEVTMLEKLASQRAEPYAVFAKSIGTLVTLKAIHEGRIAPVHCTFVGMPLAWKEKDYPIAAWLKDFKLHTLFIQNNLDPAASFAHIEKRLTEARPEDYSLLKLPGDSHDYLDLPAVRDIIVSTFQLGFADSRK